MVKKIYAEFLGTFTLVFIGAGAIVVGKADLLGIAMAHGLAIAVMICAFAAVSGAHFNPAVSFGMLVTGRISIKDFFVYVLSQLAGATVAAGLLKAIMGSAAGGALGIPALAPGVGTMQAMLAEALGTFLLVSVIFGVAVDRRGTFGVVAGFPIGLTISLSILFFGPLTGAAINPARWFGPALISGHFSHALVWIIGPLVGGAAASLIYQNVIQPEK